MGGDSADSLTPEILEDETRRGDFVIKWAVVLLAVLMGSTLIDETATLVHVKTGQLLAARGGLPPALDFLAYTTADRPWTNLSWLFDILLAGIYSITGWIGVSVVKSLLVVLTFGLLIRVNRTGGNDWWGSVCAVLAVVACQPQLVATPDLITLLGMSLALWLLHAWYRKPEPRTLWWLVPVFLLWSNLDSRMFLGLGAVLLFALGETVAQQLRPGSAAAPLRPLWIATGAAALAATVHPFGWKWLTGPVLLYGRLYPAIQGYASEAPGIYQQYFPMLSRVFFQNLHFSAISGLGLAVCAGGALVLNRTRVPGAHLALYAGALVMMLANAHESPVASLVFAAIAAWNGQEWASLRVRRKARVSVREVLFARGLRALTVLGLFILALFIISGRSPSMSRRRLGFGIDQSLANVIANFQQELAETNDLRPFNFVPAQGDILIWVGKQPFIDNRLGLFAGRDDQNLVSLFKNVRSALSPRALSQPTAEAIAAQRKTWKETFDKYQVHLALPRLNGFNPDYGTLQDLVNSPDWTMTRLGSAVAVFCRKDVDSPELKQYRETHKLDFRLLAFGKDSPPPEPRGTWPLPRSSWTDRFWVLRPPLDPQLQLAQHMLTFAQGHSVPRPEFAYLALRAAQQALSHNPNDADAYFIVGEAQYYLGHLETLILNRPMREGVIRYRYYQACMAHNLAILAGDNAQVHVALLRIYQAARRLDLALREAQTLKRMQVQSDLVGNAEFEKQVKALSELEANLQGTLQKIEEQAEQGIKEGANPLQVADFYLNQGCILHALELLEKNAEAVQQNPELQLLLATLLLESGRIEDADVLSLGLETQGGDRWQTLRAFTLLAAAHYNRAILLLKDQARHVDRMGFAKVLASLPPRFVASPKTWPVGELEAALQYMRDIPHEVGSLQLNAAVSQIEAGENAKAVESFREILARNPESLDRSLIVYYLFWLTGEELDVFPPSQQIPILFEDE